MLKLTPRQAEILAFIKRCLEDNGYPPTRAEIAQELGFKSPNAAEEHLKALARKGAIEMTPGASRVEPRRLAETVEEAGGTRRLTSLAMLYGAPTGLDAPAPGTEYVLVSAVEEGSRAWVEIRAGIDVNPATLQIA